jgi:hypothetical protein
MTREQKLEAALKKILKWAKNYEKDSGLMANIAEAAREALKDEK